MFHRSLDIEMIKCMSHLFDGMGSGLSFITSVSLFFGGIKLPKGSSWFICILAVAKAVSVLLHQINAFELINWKADRNWATRSSLESSTPHIVVPSSSPSILKWCVCHTSKWNSNAKHIYIGIPSNQWNDVSVISIWL